MGAGPICQPGAELIMRVALGVLMALHGVAHLVGFVVPWKLVAPESGTYTTTILDGRIDLGSNGIRTLGLIWLGLAIGFVFVAAGSWLRLYWWMDAAIGLAAASLVLCLLGWPDSRIGVPVNLAILAALLLGTRLHWL
jgi:hypothetical protein